MRSDPSGRRVSCCRGLLNYCQTSEQLVSIAIAATCQTEPQINSRASNIPGQLLVAIESVVFLTRGRETAAKDP